MPKVNGEVIHQPLHVGPLAVPLGQAMDRKGVPKVVQPRLEATAVGALHAGIFPQSLEGILPMRSGEPLSPRLLRKKVTGRAWLKDG